ncbi:pantoate--beta-alanine ligase [Ectothiorhodospira lacustris]|uniref:pantoate--beta-alanine ligase n=1 Tax=Ectothiorhodospira lacustris TaxID=2899127 RepID=UPI001EE8FA78|nr:pantoate--beta-alanine ligase [Ectothiorhodospira lacustris]MCG5500180.1 pantoate--beta-alanine ligase [Ectothiorhodospira lacustris]MCG5511321.1 pantoate--beta-alanine ligase [Ectothiorhodospira lacustris]MCG5523049.1 pantoate--beta-alanine ligase [Ectothiorhodospira lacustris]
MDIVHHVTDLRGIRRAWQAEGCMVALVPTMGNLHEGHLSLVRHARTLADRVVVSIFVNPLQFDRAEDLAAYPRTLAQDCRLLADEAADLVFAPPENELYPAGRGQVTRVEVPGLSALLEGAHRPGHFAGVATVVCKLFNLVQPDVAVFGEKDFQQLLLIRRMVADLDIPVRIEGLATVRETDGLAMSSRNAYLGAGERPQAPAIHQALSELAARLQAGERDYAALEREAEKILEKRGLRSDYVAVRRRRDLSLPQPGDTQLVILAAAWLGRARLIDNLCLDLPSSAG